MEIEIYTIYDELAEQYNTPIFGILKIVEREITQLLNDNKITHPQDKKLYCIGKYNVKSGEITNTEKKLINNLLAYNKK